MIVKNDMSLTGNSNQEKIWNYLYDKLGNAYGVAGIEGNLYAESGLNPINLQDTYESSLGYSDKGYCDAVDKGTYTNFVHDSAGWGLPQYTYYTLKQGLYDLCREKGTSIGDMESQLEYLVKVLQSDYSALWATLQTCTSVEEASNAFLLKFERPLDQSYSMKQRRTAYAQNYYNKFAEKEVAQMGICTTAQAVDAMKYWEGYYEKSSSTYASFRDKKYFEMDKGSNNWTYPGYLCGCNSQPWCAATVSTAIYEACGNDKTSAKKVMHGVWPYLACNQMWDAASAQYRGRRGSWSPKAGDVIIFSSDGKTREHTGMVISVSGSQVTTIEGNSSNRCKRNTYSLSDSWIYGYVRPLYSDAGSGVTKSYLSKGDKGDSVKELQNNLNQLGYDCGTADGDFGSKTDAAVRKFQKDHGLTVDGEAGTKTLTAIKEAIAKASGSSGTNASVDYTKYPGLKKGDTGMFVMTLQKKLNELGYNCGTADGEFGGVTDTAVRKFQSAKGLSVDGEVGPKTWAALFAREVV